MTTEAKILADVRLALSQAGCTAFRQNTGQAWAGSRIERLPGNRVLIHDARPVNFGLCVGSSDVIGWMPRRVTNDMVGQFVAVFTAVEVKNLRGRPTPEQDNFIKRVQHAGGYAGVARSAEDALQIIKKRNG